MQYSPKLKKIAEQIKNILKENDIAGSVVLHSPGYSEFFVEIAPSYSCAFFDGDILRVRAKLKENFNGDKEAWTKTVTETANMFHHLAETNGAVTLNLIKATVLIDETVKAEHIGGNGFTSHTQQNN